MCELPVLCTACLQDNHSGIVDATVSTQSSSSEPSEQMGLHVLSRERHFQK